MNECAKCNYSTEDGICLHESARSPAGNFPNLTTAENRAFTDVTGRYCGREGRFWAPRPLAMPSAPQEAA